MQLWETQWLSAWIRLKRVAAVRDSLHNRVTRETHHDPVGCGGSGTFLPTAGSQCGNPLLLLLPNGTARGQDSPHAAPAGKHSPAPLVALGNVDR